MLSFGQSQPVRIFSKGDGSQQDIWGVEVREKVDICFVHPIFRFWFLITFGDEVRKIQKYYVFFACILQGKMGKIDRNWKENRARDENMG